MDNYKIQKELNIWDNRVIYNVKFKENTKAPLNKLEEYYNKSIEKFVVLVANSEALVYKIGRFFVSKGLENRNITFIDGSILDTYIGDETVEWKKKDRVDDFFNIFKDDFKGKWVIIPLMRFQCNKGIGIYLISQFRKYGAIGLIFYSEGPDNIAETLITGTDMQYIYQFPKADYYSKRKRKLPDDEW